LEERKREMVHVVSPRDIKGGPCPLGDGLDFSRLGTQKEGEAGSYFVVPSYTNSPKTQE
jgi:hypothetical protein